MTVPRLFAQRLVFALLTVYLVVSFAFVVVAITDDPSVNLVRRAAAMEAKNMPPEERAAYMNNQVEAYKEARNLNEPLLDRYVHWLTDYSRFDWGTSWNYGHPVASFLAHRLLYTVGYLVPAFVLGSLGGIVVGAAAAIRGGYLERGVMSLASVGFGIPLFLLAVLGLTFVGTHFGYSPDGHEAASVPATIDPLSLTYLHRAFLPILVVGVGVGTGIVRHAHNQTKKQLSRQFVTTLRAKGGDDTTVGRHLLRLSAPVLASLVATDFLSALVLTVYVTEFVFSIPGFGDAMLTAVVQRDLPLLLGATVVVVLTGVTLSSLTDLLRAVADPRT